MTICRSHRFPSPSQMPWPSAGVNGMTRLVEPRQVWILLLASYKPSPYGHDDCPSFTIRYATRYGKSSSSVSTP